KKTKGIIENNAEYKIYLPAFERHNKIVSKLIEPPADQKAFYLGKALDEMLKDPKGPKDAGKDEDRLNAFWDRTDDPKIVTLRGEIEQLEKAVKYGEPFIVLADNKKGGKVLAVMTTAGKEWNDWGGGSGATILYQPLIWETIHYPTGQAEGQSNGVGRPGGDEVTVVADLEQHRQKGKELRLARFRQEFRKDEPALVSRVANAPLAGVKESVHSQTYFRDANKEPGIYLTHLLASDDPDEARP